MKRLYRVLLTALLALSASLFALAQGMAMGTPRIDDDLLRFAYSMGAYNGIVAVCGAAQEKEQAQGYFDQFMQRVEQRVPGYDLQSLQGNFSLGESSEAMLERAQAGDHWSMELLEFDDPEFDPFYLHTVFRGDEAIGMVTSGSFGHRLHKAIGLAYFRDKVGPEDILHVEILGRKTIAKIGTRL